MAGTLTISTLSDGTNSTSATNCIQGSAKAWVNFNGVSGAAVRASYNVSSVTRNGTGDYTVNFSSALPDTNGVYLIRQLAQQGRDSVVVSFSTTSIRYQNQITTTGSLQDNDYQMLSVFR